MSVRILGALFISVAAVAWGGARATAQAPAPTPSKETSPAQAAAPAAKPQPVQPRRFASSEEATEAFVTALRAHDTNALVGIFGSEARPVIFSGDPVADRRARDAFLEAFNAGHTLVAKGTDAMTLRVGSDAWPFPIPIVKQGERWRLDTRQGREEILARRIGRNELNTMQVCLAVVDAQREYYADDRTGRGVLAYAQKFLSTPGKHDGLHWETKPGEPLSPLGDLVARARAEGYRRDQSGGPTPYHGYLFRMLTSQGPDAPGGAYDYIVRSYMIAGFGVVAYPAQYGVSGVMTFIVNHDGVVYEKDLGPTTAALAAAMRTFNPDKTWSKADAAN